MCVVLLCMLPPRTRQVAVLDILGAGPVRGHADAPAQGNAAVPHHMLAQKRAPASSRQPPGRPAERRTDTEQGQDQSNAQAPTRAPKQPQSAPQWVSDIPAGGVQVGYKHSYAAPYAGTSPDDLAHARARPSDQHGRANHAHHHGADVSQHPPPNHHPTGRVAPERGKASKPTSRNIRSEHHATAGRHDDLHGTRHDEDTTAQRRRSEFRKRISSIRSDTPPSSAALAEPSQANSVFQVVAGDGEDAKVAARKKEKFIRARQRKMQARGREKAQQEALKKYPVQKGSHHTAASQSSHSRAPAHANAASSSTNQPAPDLRSPTKPAELLRPDDIKTRTNKQLISNAIIYTCLAGPVNKTAKDQVLEGLAASHASHFVMLLHDPNDLKYRAVYEFDLSTNIGSKVAGRGPATLRHKKMSHYYRYNSGTRRFSPIQTSEMTPLVDAVCITTSKNRKRPGNLY